MNAPLHHLPLHRSTDVKAANSAASPEKLPAFRASLRQGRMRLSVVTLLTLVYNLRRRNRLIAHVVYSVMRPAVFIGYNGTDHCKVVS